MEEREKSGSTFLNEGIALPHARLEGVAAPQIALALTQPGVLDAPVETPIEIVFMLLSPVENAQTHLKLLARAARLFQSRELRRRLAKQKNPAQVLEQIRRWESDAM